MEKNAENRIMAINKYRVTKVLKEIEARNAMNNAITLLQSKIKALSPRITDLITVANVCGENGICLGKEPSNLEAPEFVTEGINHRLGFYDAKQNPYKGIGSYNRLRITGIGYAGGGCCGENFLVDSEGNIYEGWTHKSETIIRKMKLFLDEFDSFETDFYHFIDQLC